MPRFRQPYSDIDHDENADSGPDALDSDRETDPKLREASLPDPDFELVRQAYPNRPRPYGVI